MDEETNVIQNEIEETYPIKDLIENCEALTGYRKEVAVGALFDCGKEEMTKKEFKGRIKNFLERKVN
ncbi:hypothetical protein [Clostridium botulinum]|uniref:hypothetical protein n=1 Tax=Clostridium botulinum TaxID=1491 RepID=UPI0005F9918E|nr:hypothetical protein [Clostridium botulinum]APQ76066.1 hypothetical protein RSJ10_2397 [Clostridium botulinum]MBN3354008.1 hypothetical protein [Clostridium botulinum]QDY29408.1 hypothetical protein CGQ41_11600 [Clostridium botulinum]